MLSVSRTTSLEQSIQGFGPLKPAKPPLPGASEPAMAGLGKQTAHLIPRVCGSNEQSQRPQPSLTVSRASARPIVMDTI